MTVTKLTASSIKDPRRFNSMKASVSIPPARVSGGNIESTSGGFEYYGFTSSGTLTVESPGHLSVMLVAGGGGGGSNNGNLACGSGGGAGQIVYNPFVYVDSGSIAVVIGSGGGVQAAGNQSIFSFTNQGESLEIEAWGGGAGRFVNVQPDAGGSGSGNGDDLGGQARPRTYSNQPFYWGNSGGPGVGGNSAGGGGGAGQPGGAKGTSSGGNGTNYFTDWGVAISKGQLISGQRWFAGGGGGGAQSVAGGPGGFGGGGNGARDSANGGSGTANTGGGGGGTEHGGTPGSGGSGIVIVRVAT